MLVIYFLLAVLPPISIVYYVYSQDLYEKEPRKILVISFLFGCLITLPAAIIESKISVLIISNLFLYAFIGVAFVEEGLKFVVLKFYSYKRPDFNEPYDGIVYSVCISLGFATVENIGYVFGEEGYELITGIGRTFSAIPLHASCGIIMGYYLGISKFSKNKYIFIIKGLGYAVLIHGFYDYFLFEGSYIVFSFICLLIAVYFSKKAITLHQKNSPFNKSNKITNQRPEKIKIIKSSVLFEINEDDSLIALIKKYKYADKHNRSLILNHLENKKETNSKYFDLLQLIYNNKL